MLDCNRPNRTGIHIHLKTYGIKPQPLRHWSSDDDLRYSREFVQWEAWGTLSGKLTLFKLLTKYIGLRHQFQST